MTYFYQIPMLSVPGSIQDDWAVRAHLMLQKRAGWTAQEMEGKMDRAS